MEDVISEFFKDDFKKAEERGEKKTNERIALEMLMDNVPFSMIKKYTRLSEDAIKKMADTNRIQFAGV